MVSHRGLYILTFEMFKYKSRRTYNLQTIIADLWGMVDSNNS